KRRNEIKALRIEKQNSLAGCALLAQGSAEAPCARPQFPKCQARLLLLSIFEKDESSVFSLVAPALLEQLDQIFPHRRSDPRVRSGYVAGYRSRFARSCCTIPQRRLQTPLSTKANVNCAPREEQKHKSCLYPCQKFAT